MNVCAYDKSLDRAQNAIERRPDYPHAYYVLALVLGHLGREEDGRTALSKCDELHPGFVESRMNWQPYVDPKSNEALQEGLRRLGVESTED